MSKHAVPEQSHTNEYEHEAVPMASRRSTFSVSLVWLGGPMTITAAITGSMLVSNMGFLRALLAILIGNFLLFAYTALLAQKAYSTGLNAALQASTVFGRKGYVVVSGLLSTLVLGWFAVQTGLTGALIHTAVGVNYLYMTAIAGLLYLAITCLGIRGLHWIGLISAPLFAIVGGWVAFDSVSSVGWDSLIKFSGSSGGAPMLMGVGVTVVIALFADGATMTADYSRWAPSTRGALISTFCAFPFAMSIAMLFGGVMTAALQVPNANPFGLDNMFGYLVAQHKPWLSMFALIFLLINLCSICSHCLYFSAVGYSRMTRIGMRSCAAMLGLIGTAIAAGNVWAFFIPWLSLLGIIVPPIGAILIVDSFYVRRNATIDRNYRPTAFVAWAIGSLVAICSELYAQWMSTAIVAFAAAAISYAIISVSVRAGVQAAAD